MGEINVGVAGMGSGLSLEHIAFGSFFKPKHCNP